MILGRKLAAHRELIEQLCGEALEYGFCSVCVNPTHVARCKAILSGSRVKVCTVIGFPLGASLVSTLRQEATALILLGVREMDMVIPIGLL